MSVKVALMDKFGKSFTEGDNFKLYALGFLEGGCEVFQLDPYTINFGESKGKVFILKNEKGFCREGKSFFMNLNDFDVIVDLSDIADKDFAERLNKVDVLHVNPPLASYTSADKKTYIKNYLDFIPETIVSSNIDELEGALERFKVMVIKDPFGSCGKGVEKIGFGDKNVREVLEVFTEKGKKEIVAQRFLHFALEGGKRVAVVGDVKNPDSYRIIHFYRRVPSRGNWKDNLSQGASAVEIEDLREDEKKLCLEIVKKSGLYTVGLDIMDDLDEDGRRIPRLVETNAVLVCSSNGKNPEKIKPITNFILDELI